MAGLDARHPRLVGSVSFVLYKVVGLVFPLRADEQDEWSGMDSSESGERRYIHTDIGVTSGSTVHA